MDFNESLRLAIRNISRRKLRTGLTVLGIIVGILAIVALISLAQGLQDSIGTQFGRLGAQNILVTKKGLTGPPIGVSGITQRDVDFIRGFSEFEFVLPGVFEPATLGFDGEKVSVLITATDADLSDKRIELIDVSFTDGRNLRSTSSGEVILGYTLSKETFDKEIVSNSRVKINDASFKVVGILEREGDNNVDSLVSMTREDADILFKRGDSINAINAKVKDGVNIDETASKVKRKLDRFRGEDDTEVQTAAQLQEQFRTITGIVGIIVVGIAAISLVVGGIGIANSMFTSVLERTREIGVMKSIGARNSEILSLFLLEAGIVGFFGGIIGVLFGIVISLGIQFGAGLAGIEISVRINPWVIFSALFLAVLIGMISGLVPALQAARQKPVDALRYE